MAERLPIDLLVDEQKLGRFNLTVLLWSFLAMLADGYDISALASAAPELARSWHILPVDFGPALSASLFGILLGAPALGLVGDRFGRRGAVIVGCVIFGLGTLACVAAVNLHQIAAFRFVTGIGIGGLMPNAIALNSELSPKRLRATLVILMFTGITAGSTLASAIQAWLIPRYGWPIMFWIGGLGPLLIAAMLPFTLPESVKYLSVHPDRRAELLTTLRRLRPDLAIAADAEIVAAPAPPAGGTGLAQLFTGGLAWITPLLWCCFATVLMVHYFLLSWLPLMLVNSGMSTQESGIATGYYFLGGTIGGLLISLVLGRFGYTAISLLFVAAIPAIAALGAPGLPPQSIALVAALAGFAALGAQFGNNAASGLLYPTAIRARGVGWALGIGRVGSILGPLVGGTLIGMKLPFQRLFLLAAAPMVIGLIASISVAILCRRRLGGLHLDDMPLAKKRRRPHEGRKTQHIEHSASVAGTHRKSVSALSRCA